MLTLFTLIAFVTGACIGSFVTMASWRLPRGEEIVFTPSHCPQCNTTLGVKDLFPMLSWIWTRGSCRHCAMPVGIRYPLTELALAISFASLMIAFGPGFESLILAALVTELAILIVTDLEHTIIPDGVQIALFFTGIVYDIWRQVEWETVVPGMVFGLGLGLTLHFGYKWLRKKDGLGWADVKFLGVAGIWLPIADFVPFLFLAGVLGTLTGLLWQGLKRGPVFPFGPALAVSLFINVLWPDLLGRFIP